MVSRHRLARLDLAQQAFRAARFSDALEALDGLDGFSDAALLRARILLKRDPAAALPILSRLERNPPSGGKREAFLLAGVCYARLGDARAAEAKFKAAAPYSGDSAFRAELAYQRAAAAWIARKLDAAERLLEGATLEGHVLLDAYVLRGAIAASRGRLAEQGALLLQARRHAQAMRDAPVMTVAVIASQIAYLARELPGTALRDAAVTDLPTIPWTSDIGDIHFTMQRAVGWRYALDGDEFNAFRRLKDAATLAPSHAWRVMSLCDRAYFATCLGERRWAEQELSDARDLATRVNWHELTGEECFALLLLAELLAPRDASLALAYVAQYKSLGSRFSKTLASAGDRRVTALEAYSFGVVAKTLGESDEAARRLCEAWHIYNDIGYDWRSARAALALADVLGESEWRDRAAKALEAYPKSWLVRDGIVSRPARAELAQAVALTPARRAVYRLLLRGLSTAEIAAEQGRSEFTVRNHIKVIFKSFNVTSRPALLALASGSKSDVRGDTSEI